jgi:antitoxin YefM
MTMATLNATEARANLYKLIDDTVASHVPVIITGKRGNAVLLAEEDWNAINETLHLLSVPGMRESIVEGMQEPLDDCANALDW